MFFYDFLRFFKPLKGPRGPFKGVSARFSVGEAHKSRLRPAFGRRDDFGASPTDIWPTPGPEA